VKVQRRVTQGGGGSVFEDEVGLIYRIGRQDGRCHTTKAVRYLRSCELVQELRVVKHQKQGKKAMSTALKTTTSTGVGSPDSHTGWKIEGSKRKEFWNESARKGTHDRKTSPGKRG